MESTDLAPRLIARRCGGWLAVSLPGEALQIGAVGDSEEDARARYHESRTQCEAALVKGRVDK
jgi:hypothetical protein